MSCWSFGLHLWGMLVLHSTLADLAASVLQPWLVSDSSQLGYWVVNHLVVLWLPGRSTAGLGGFCSGTSALGLGWWVAGWASSIMPALRLGTHSVGNGHSIVLTWMH